MEPIPYLALFESKRGRRGRQNIKLVSRHIHQNLLSKNKVSVYAYAARMNILTSCHLKVWDASIFGGKIFDEDDVYSVVGMKTFLTHSYYVINSI